MCLHYSFSVFLFLPPSVGVLKEVSETEKGCQEGGRGAVVPGEDWDSTPSSYISRSFILQPLQTERALLEPSRAPENEEDFERLLVSHPNSSALWVQYMAFLLQTAEVDRARAAGERALAAISFR